MTIFKTLGTVLICICLSFSLGSYSSAQQFFTPSQNRRPVQPVQQRRVVPSQPVQQRRVVRSQTDSQFFHPGQTNQGRIVRTPSRFQIPSVAKPVPTRAPKSARTTADSVSIGLARAKIAELNDEIEDLKKLNTELKSGEKQNKYLKDAQSKIVKLNGEIKDLKELNTKLKSSKADNEKLKDAQSKISLLSSEIKELKELNADLKSSKTDGKKLEEAQSKIAELNKSLDDLKAKQTKNPTADATEVESTKLSDANAQLKTETERLKNANKAMTDELVELREQLKDSSDRMSENVGARKNQIQKLESEIEAAVEKNETLTGQIDTLKQENAELKKIADSGEMLKSELNASTSRLPKLETKIQSLTTQNDKFKALNQELSEAKKKLEADVAAVREKSDSIQSQYKTAAKESAQLSDRVKELSTQNKEYLSSNDKFKELNQELTKTNEKLEADIVAVREKSDSMQAQQKVAAKENEALSDRVAELSSKMKEYKELAKTNEKLRGDVDAAREKSDALQAKYQTFTKEKEVLSKRVAELYSQNEKYLRKINLLNLKTGTKKAEPQKEDFDQIPTTATGTKTAEESLLIAELGKDNATQESASTLLLGETPVQTTEIEPLEETNQSPVTPVADVKDATGWGQDVYVWLVPLLVMLFAIGIFSLFREDYSRKSK